MAIITHELIKLSHEDGSWNLFKENWRSQCEKFDEDFDTYAQASLPVLESEVCNPTKDVGVFALKSSDGDFEAVAYASSSYIPGYQEKVLRVRHLLLSPYFDFGEYAIESYSKVLARMVSRTIGLASGALPSRHVKFHLRSPGDREFFAAAAEVFGEAAFFYDVAIRGTWLHMSIRPQDAG